MTFERTYVYRGLAAVALGVLCASAAASAQEPTSAGRVVAFPGSLSATVGTVSPSESGNAISSMTAEQGITFWQSNQSELVAFAAVTLKTDTAGNPWNNTIPAVVGVKIIRTLRFGVGQAGFGVNTSGRARGAASTTLATYLSYWSGWRNDRAPQGRGITAFPGHVWATSGYMTPFEPHNWLTLISADQGVALYRAKGIELVTYGALTHSIDTQGLAWNSRSSIDAGVKASRSVSGGVVEAGVARRYEHNRVTHLSQSAPVVYVNFWRGWNPRVH